MSGPTLTLAEAARRCSCSESTIRRKLRADAIEGATRLEDGSWSIPITGLIAAKLLDKTTPPDSPGATVSDTLSGSLDNTPDSPTVELERQLIEARHENDLLRAERDAARAELVRADQTIEVQGIALRMLEAGSGHQNAPDAETPSAAPDTRTDTSDAARERATGWLRRTFGR